jgi:hypothetical protein
LLYAHADLAVNGGIRVLRKTLGRVDALRAQNIGLGEAKNTSENGCCS